MSELKKYLLEGWTTDQLENLVDIRVSNVDKKSIGNEPSVRLCNYMDVYSNEYITSNIQFMKATAAKIQISKFIVKKGDVMITKDSETPDDIGIAAVSLEDFEDVVCGYHLALFKPYKEIIGGEFLAKQLGQYEVNRHFANKANGSTRYGLTLDVIKSAIIPFPVSVGKQREIAHILTACDTVIKKTQSAIAKYKAIKQGLLHDLFTRGLDSNGKLRPSYQDAPILYKDSELGMMPKEWKVNPLNDIFSVSSGNALTQNNIQHGTCPVYGGNGINGYHNQYLFDKKRLIIGRVGEYCGNVFITKPHSWVTDNALIISFFNGIVNLSFWLYYLNFLNLNNLAYAAAQPVITGNLLSKVKSVNIESEEQEKIVKRLSTLDNKLQTEEILLQKYQSIKRGLMGDLLGGKKEVQHINYKSCQ